MNGCLKTQNGIILATNIEQKEICVSALYFPEKIGKVVVVVVIVVVSGWHISIIRQSMVCLYDLEFLHLINEHSFHFKDFF